VYLYVYEGRKGERLGGERSRERIENDRRVEGRERVKIGS
jgi:hypothetical protein